MTSLSKERLPGTQLFRVAPITDKTTWKVSGGQSMYRIFWLQNRDDQFSHELYIAGPESEADLPDHATGHQISFREEVLAMLECQHYQPFQIQSGVSMLLQTSVKNPRCRADIHAVIGKMESIDGDTDSVLLLPGLLKVFLVYVSRHFENVEREADVSYEGLLYSAFIDLLNEKRSERKTVSAYAKELSVNMGTLNQAIKKMTGFTASYHIQQRVIRRAKQAALGSQASMKEVAYELGFHDIAHFSKYFRVNTGMTFSDFKRNFQIM